GRLERDTGDRGEHVGRRGRPPVDQDAAPRGGRLSAWREGTRRSHAGRARPGPLARCEPHLVADAPKHTATLILVAGAGSARPPILPDVPPMLHARRHGQPYHIFFLLSLSKRRLLVG